MRRLTLRLVLASLALASCLLTPALAQTSPFLAMVVPNCGAVNNLPLSQPHMGYMDQSGNFCTSASGASVAATMGVSGLSRIPSSSASNNLTLAKAGASRAFTFQGCNTTAATIYLRLWNAATSGAVTPGTTAVFAGPYAFPANTCIQPTSLATNLGIAVSAGLVYAFGASPLDNDTTGIGAGAITGFQLGYQ